MKLQENINRIHQVMGIITEDKKSKIIKNLIDTQGLSTAIRFMGSYDKIKKYLTDVDISKQDKIDIIEAIKSYVLNYFGGEQPQGSDGLELDSDKEIHLPELSDDEYDEYITKIGEDGVLVTIFHNGMYEDDYNIRWDNLSIDTFIRVFETINNLNT